MLTHTQICYHVVFSTKGRQPTFKANRRADSSGTSGVPCLEEYRKLLEEAGIEFEERYML
jgi:NCAIR mutase (PurE)-related protein